MKTDECFECGTTEDLQLHHVVPRSRGGTKTVPLCTQCHGKAHGRDLKGLEHSRLTKEGLERARQRGVKLGAPDPSKLHKKSLAVRRAKADKIAIKYGPKLHELRTAGKSYRECGELLDLRTKKGMTMVPASIKAIYDRYQKIKNNS